MENELKQIRKQMEQTVLNTYSFDEKLKNNVRHRIRTNSKKVKKYTFTSMLSFTVLTAIIVIIVGFTASKLNIIENMTSTQSSNGDLTIEGLAEKHPEFNNELKKLPENRLELLKVPAKVPFKVKNVSITYSNVVPNGPVDISFYSYTRGELLSVGSWGAKVPISDTEHLEKVKLKDGTTAYWKKTDQIDDGKALFWTDNENETSYQLLLMMPATTKNTYTKEDLIEIANSLK
ncbi:hypothetical protein [Peribacillus deserti]|uniref:DUF4367 domain-containing protein n=1 Tax=Peribacillus deserti TaxID=673318 RepID=A0A2N5M4I4_9BACI|nr:hypothetical protein [Peribacillus deserti]PLT29270.1 hypothetical protein CUU66_13955 [Peribacillus deserti]